jgi:hypothetical protein
MTIAKHYLNNAIAEFLKLKSMADKSFAQLADKDFYYKPDAEDNSLAIIIRHMSGNMISRWTNFLTTDGEKPNRNRDGEFEDKVLTKAELLVIWEQGWQVFMDTMYSLTEADAMKEITIRGEKHTVIQAINRQLTHYGYHTGQIVYLAKHIRSSDWATLSIPKKK